MASVTSTPFDSIGAFNGNTGAGPARTLSESLKEIQLGSQWVVEFLDVADDDRFIKNHIVPRVLFAEPYVHTNEKHDTPTIPMELAGELLNVIEEEKSGVYFNRDLKARVPCERGCGEDFADEDAMRLHLLSHDGSMFRCTFCKKHVAATIPDLRAHQTKHTHLMHPNDLIDVSEELRNDFPRRMTDEHTDISMIDAESVIGDGSAGIV
ncbi:unnamed protein product [Rhizoctonia solani]|uniref:C2H2-type domain-containing protein n=1 Tax=Rhizoctonia solani TaxID=456999 RepID=A0A8H3HB77_9AGAM|nr:unnamed protein product [Rhizoctonia solani]